MHTPRSGNRYSVAKAPSVVPRVWRWLSRLMLLVVALCAAYLVGNTVYNEMRRVYPAAELGWTELRAIKQGRMGLREFNQNVGLERRYIEDSMRSLLPPSINVLSMWSTCGESNCVRPSLANLMSLLPQASDPAQFTQRVCGLGTRFVGANIAGVVWEYDATRAKCVAANWNEIAKEVKSANTSAMLAGLVAAILAAVLLVLLGWWVIRAIEAQIDANEREISIEP